jgi:large subunit ribosomal protein L25
MATSSTRLDVTSRTPEGSRQARRLRRTGRVPGILYGGSGSPVSFDIDARELRIALAASGAVLDVSIDGAAPTPALLKDLQRDAVRGHTKHVDLLRVRLDRPIEAVVSLELTGGESAPGVIDGGVLEQTLREVTVSALPAAIPESLTHDVSTLNIGDTVLLGAVSAPAGVEIAGDPEAVIAIVSAPRLSTEGTDEIEQETQVVGEKAKADGDDEAAEDTPKAEADGEAGDSAAPAAE